MADDDETQTETPEGEKPEAKPVTQEDLKALTSKFQGQLSTANKTIDDLSQSRATLEVQLAETRDQLEHAKGAITINEDTPPEEVKAKFETLQKESTSNRQMAIGAFNGWVEAAAERDALKLALEYDAADQVSTLTRTFAETARKDGEKGLRLAFKEAEVELKSAKAAKAEGEEKKSKPKYDDNVQAHRPAPRVVDEMKDIDVTTLEGRKAWDEKKRDFAKRSKIPVS